MKIKRRPILICTPFTGQTSRGGFFMHYSYEFKLKCVELYRQGQWPKTPEGVTQDRFRHSIREWVRIENNYGVEGLKHKKNNKVWSPEEKYELVAKVMAGDSRTGVALKAGVSAGLLYQWVRKYNELGYNGLVNMKKGRPSKEPQMKKKTSPTPLTESEREELIRLRAEMEYLRTELAVRKKLEALRLEKEAARLKAKKQQSSNPLEKKDSN